ncbi:Asp-domain-containing protein [Saccharata proteae CBS 121410]|uniref:Asp-domain-containing protein n=1 Tax=Saccharata proteae CBS 121410 TaxID=1314787 RepID=A0A9P4HQP2_9PEZI|nr:Asp-domain-containing protein [Saccharata proteae CBS 121410]
MPSFAQLTALAALTSLVVATPVELTKRSTWTLKQELKGQKLKNGPKQIVKTYQKYGAQPPSDAQSAAAAATHGLERWLITLTAGTVTATPEDEYDSLYLSPVQVGEQTLMLDFDTGSSDLWVFSTELSSSEQTGHSVYNPRTSGTKKNGYSWDISYGDGSGASGDVYADKVVVGGVTATSQAVEAATSLSSEFTEDTDDDGLLGMGFSSINTVEPRAQSTFFDNVKSSLAKELFAVELKKGEAGSYDFGFTDSSKYTGDFAYTDVDNSEGYWGFTPTGYAVGDGSVVSDSFSAIADTGTTLIYMPTSIAAAYYDQVEGSGYSRIEGGYIFPCDADLPDFTLVIGGEERTVPGSYLNYSPVTSSECFGGIQRNTDIGLSIVGDVFLKSQYVVFDQTESTPRLGFAAQAGVSTKRK